MIRFEKLNKKYRNGKHAAIDIDFQVESGEIFGFIGPNGAGKTTTLKMLTGIMRPTSGTAVIAGYDIVKEPVEAKRSFAFVPDHPEVFSNVTGLEYIHFIGDMYDVPKEERMEIAMDLAGRFQLLNDLPALISSYSHGMKQKLLIIAAMVTKPKVLILDEPHVGLDPQSARILKDLMREFCNAGGTVFFSSHVLAVVENLCDRLAIIKNGAIIALGTLAEIKGSREGSLEDIFLEMTK